MERNGGRWISIDRPHKNKKKYNRKDNKKESSKFIDDSFIVLYNYYKLFMMPFFSILRKYSTFFC